ncbi:MAG: hypothetical protein ACSW8A_03320 [Lachnospiraceae bacterium]
MIKFSERRFGRTTPCEAARHLFRESRLLPDMNIRCEMTPTSSVQSAKW